MSIVHSVSDITSILSNIIQNTPTLQNVWVSGEILNKTKLQGDSPDFFILENAKNGDKIECVIYKENAHLFEVLPSVQNYVVVKGRIVLFASKGEYRFAVTGIETPGTVLKSRIVSVSNLTGNLQTTLKAHSGKVQGKIANNPEPRRGFLHLHLKNVNANEGTDGEMIECQLFPRIANNLSFPLRQGDEVSVQGQFDIFPAMSRYQITITETGNVQRVLPVNSPRNGDRVVESVYTYLSELGVKGVSPKKEHEIQFGSRNGFADVVLVDQNGGFAAIAECKVAGHVGHGIEQLKSYLSATDTRFGIFANRADRGQWEFYENRRRNQFDKIKRSEFEEGVTEGVATRDRLSDEIEALESKFNQLRGEIDTLKSKNVGIETEVRQESQKLDVLKQAIESDRADKQDLNNEIDRLRTDKTKLKTEIGKLERKESELQTSRKQWKEKIQQFETFLADLKSDLLDSEMLPQSEENADSQKASGQKKQSIMSKLKTIKLKNPFSKENE